MTSEEWNEIPQVQPYLKITVVNNNAGQGDWEGVYIDDKLFMDGHNISSIGWLDLFEHLGYTTDIISLNDEEMQMNGNSLSENLNNLYKKYR